MFVKLSEDYSENIIVVGATDKTDGIASFSNRNIDYSYVEIFAPGDDIWSCLGNNTYGLEGGTSMAAPMVAGLAGLLLNLNSSLTSAQVKNLILAGAEGTPKRINAYKSVSKCPLP
jgi:subtilisin family serine protease